MTAFVSGQRQSLCHSAHFYMSTLASTDIVVTSFDDDVTTTTDVVVVGWS